MNCPYADNAFCAALSEPTRAMLCRGCSLRRYPKGYSFSVRDVSSGLYLTVEGLAVYEKASPGEDSRGKTIMPIVSGSICRQGKDSPFSLDSAHRLYCMLDTTIASFSNEAVNRLKRADSSFIDTLYSNLMDFIVFNSTGFLEHVGFGDAEDAVRYMIRFLGKYGIRDLTHEQLAQLCNLRRPTVTKAMQNLTRNEPELFLK